MIRRIFRRHRGERRGHWLSASSPDRGATIPLVALALPVLILMTAFAVDLGRQRSSRRTMQARADAIALDMVRLADGRTELQITSDSATTVELQRSADRNSIPFANVTAVEWGTWEDGRTPEFIPTLDTGVPNAVMITASETVDYFFQPGTGSTTRSAVASQEKKAGFSIGSFAASVASGSSPLLNPLLGSALGLGALSYQGLAAVNLSFLDIATELGLASPEELFTSNVSALDLITASADILRRNDPSAAEVILLDQVIASPGAALLDGIDVQDVVEVHAGSEEAALGSEVNLLDFLGAAAFIANGASGLALPTITLGPPGFQIANGSLNLIQAPSTVYGPIGESTSTSQATALLTSSIGTLDLGNFATNTLDQIIPGTRSLLCGLLGLLLALCGNPSMAVTARLTVNVDLDLASATGTIADIRCAGADELDIDVAANLLRAAIGIQVELVANGSSIGTIPLSLINERPPANGTADFVIPPEAFDVYKAATPGVGSIMGNTTISGLGALGALLTPALNTLLNGVVTNLQAQLVDPVASLLGARLASADVAARAVDCRSVQLIG